MLLSIIIPIYNVKEYIESTVSSVLSSDFTDFELLLIDDGSTDGTSDILDDLSKTDLRIKVFHKKNGGVSSARNFGIQKSKGDYIGFVDSDDMIEPQMFKILISVAIKENADIVQCEHDRLDKVTGVSDFPYKYITTKEFLKTQYTLKGDRCTNYLALWSKVYKREMFNGIQFPIGRVFEDHAMMCKIVSNAETVIVSDTPLYHYIRRENSIITGFHPKKDRDKALALIDNTEFFKEYDYELYSMSVASLKGFLFSSCSKYYGNNNYCGECEYYINLIKNYKNTFLQFANKYDKLYLNLFGIKFFSNIIIKNQFEPIQNIIEKIKYKNQ